MPKDICIFVLLNPVIYIAITDFCVSTNGDRQPEKLSSIFPSYKDISRLGGLNKGSASGLYWGCNCGGAMASTSKSKGEETEDSVF